MTTETAAPDRSDLPETQTLMAAVIRLMAKCSDNPSVPRMRTLLSLLGELRGHPGLSRQPAVLAGLAEAHALMVERLSQVAMAEACVGNAGATDEGDCTVH